MKTDKEKIYAALYIRVSTTEQALEGYSLAAQEHVERNFCKMKGYEVYKVYSDEGISAKDIIHRPGILDLLTDARNKCFSVIVVWKLTRFSRSISNLTTVCDELDKLGVYLISCTESFDCTTPSGRMIRSVLGVIAQFEREVISENVKLGLLERARQGKPMCSHVLGYDKIDKDTFIINEKEADYVHFAYDNYLKLKDINQLTVLCRDKGYRGKRGLPPCPESLHKILTHPIYCGYNRYSGRLFKGDHVPIIAIDTYNKVQNMLLKIGKLYGRTRCNHLIILPTNGGSEFDMESLYKK